VSPRTPPASACSTPASLPLPQSPRPPRAHSCRPGRRGPLAQHAPELRDHTTRLGSQRHPENTAQSPNPCPLIPRRTVSTVEVYNTQDRPHLSSARPSSPSPSPLHSEHPTGEPRPFPGLLSLRDVAGAGVDDEGFGRRQISLSALSLHGSLPLLDLNLTSPFVSSLAARGHRHHRQSLRSTQTSTLMRHPRAPSSASFGRGASFGETAAALQPPQLALAPLGELCLTVPSS
jgi:hypothetical protein